MLVIEACCMLLCL